MVIKVERLARYLFWRLILFSISVDKDVNFPDWIPCKDA